MPSMCVPVLEMDGGMRMPETMAIARYLAREFGNINLWILEFMNGFHINILLFLMKIAEWVLLNVEL